MIKGIGIDLGTTNSVLAYVNQNDEVICIKNAEGKSLTPSAVTFYNNEFVVGEGALNNADVDNVASYFKPHIGSTGFIHELGNHRLGVIELSGMVLSKLKEDAAAYIGEEIKKVVITVPAYFMAPHRDATIAAAKLAGLEVIKLINEPTAAALYYGIGKEVDSGYILVYDLGGGTFDVSLVRIEKDKIEVVASRGDYNLGGANWRDAIADYLAQLIMDDCGIDIKDDYILLREIKQKAEKAKNSLSTLAQATLNVYVGGAPRSYTLTRSDFENMTSYLMGQTTNLIDDLLRDAGFTSSQLQKILLVGGSCRMPMVAQTLKTTYNTEIKTCSNLDEVVACGAALEAARSKLGLVGITSGNSSRLSLRSIHDVIGHSLGLIATDDERTMWVNSILIPKDTVVPADRTEPFELVVSSSQNSMDVYLTQGEERDPRFCTVVSRYEIKNIPPSKAGKQTIKITYSYNESGIIEVMAKTGEGTGLDAVKHSEVGDIDWLNRPPCELRQYASRNVILAVDLSGSMSGNPLRKSQEAARKFIADLHALGTKIGLIIFADLVKLQCSLTDDLSLLLKCVDQWKIGREVGACNDGIPFDTARDELEGLQGDKWILVLSDGVWSNQEQAVSEAKKCHKQDILVVGIGFGAADEEFLEEISNSNLGSCFTDLENLSSSFSRIASEIGSGRARIR